MIKGPATIAPASIAEVHRLGAEFWPLKIARELEDAILHLRFNEESVGTWIFRTQGDRRLVESHDRALADFADDWLVREITLYLKRTLARLDVTSRSLFAHDRARLVFRRRTAGTRIGGRSNLHARGQA